MYASLCAGLGYHIVGTLKRSTCVDNDARLELIEIRIDVGVDIEDGNVRI